MANFLGYIGYNISYCFVYMRYFFEEILKSFDSKIYKEVGWQDAIFLSEVTAKAVTVDKIGYW